LDLTEASEKLVIACRILYREGILDYMGHVSARVSDGNFLITPRFAAFASMRKEDLILVNIKGEVIGGDRPPPLELPMHLAIYSHSDVMSIVHAHPKFSTALAIAGIPLKPVHQLALPFFSGVPILNYFGMIDTPEKGEALAQALRDHRAVLLANHGVVIAGSSVEEACVLSIWLERCAELQLLAGENPPNLIRDEREALQLMAHQLRVTVPSAWEYYKRKVEGVYD